MDHLFGLPLKSPLFTISFTPVLTSTVGIREYQIPMYKVSAEAPVLKNLRFQKQENHHQLFLDHSTLYIFFQHFQH